MPPSLPWGHLAGEGLGARVGVAGGNGVVEVELDTGVLGVVGAGEGDAGGLAGTAALDLDLGAAEVELGAARLAGRVQGNVLDAEQVVAGRDAGGDGGRDLAAAVRGPGEAALGEVGPVLVDLEPDVTAAVEVGRRLALRGLGHVEGHGAWVADVAVDPEADLVAGLDRHGLGALAAGRVLVTADGVGLDVLDGAVGVEVGRLADELPILGGLAVVDQSRECVCHRFVLVSMRTFRGQASIWEGGTYSGLKRPRPAK